MSQLMVENLRAGFGDQFQLRNVSFVVERGDIVGLIGPNGGGKSTLLKALAGVIPITGGRVEFDGRPLQRARGEIAFVPQREDVHWGFPAAARDVVLMGRYRGAGWLRRPGRDDRRKAEDLLARFGLAGMGDRHISQFSGGQQQRIFIARAFIQEPRIVLLDEPLTGVDAANRAVLHEAINDFSRRGVIVMIATHDLDEVESTCSHLCCLNQRLVAFGPTAGIFTPEILRATFGGRVAVFP